MSETPAYSRLLASPDGEPASPPRPALSWLMIVALFGLVYCLAVTWREPPIDLHGFRQAQTAISSYWMLRGGDWLMYETPVFGAPWQAPFEFPLYQWLVAWLVMLTGFTVDQAGRLLSALFLVATVWPLRAMLRGFGADRDLQALASAFLLASPLYVFWGRSIMIETLALLLAVGYVATMQRWIATRAWRWVVAATVLAVLAALVKITTFLAFALLAGVLVAMALRDELRPRRDWRRALKLAAASGATILLALVALRMWVHWTDALKAQQPLTASLVSERLQGFLIGPLELRLSSAFWWDDVALRIIPNSLGYAWALGLALLAWALLKSRRTLLASLAGIGLFLVPTLVFANLHHKHSYYPLASGIFLIVVLAVLLHAATRRGPAWLRPVLAVAVLLGMALEFQASFLPPMSHRAEDSRTLKLAAFLRDNTPRDSILVVTGMRWSPEMPYYAERRAIMLLHKRRHTQDATWVTPAMLVTREHPQGAPIGALVSCGEDQPSMRPLFAQMGPHPRKLRKFGCDLVLRAAPRGGGGGPAGRITQAAAQPPGTACP